MLIEKNINGSIVISELVRGLFITRVYYGYTKRECIRMFCDEIKSNK
mgnify:CR=1 FL=1